jgi:hypothetical protein
MILVRYDKDEKLLRLTSPELTLGFIREKLNNLALYTFTPSDYSEEATEKGVATICCYSEDNVLRILQKLRSRGLEVRV